MEMKLSAAPGSRCADRHGRKGEATGAHFHALLEALLETLMG